MNRQFKLEVKFHFCPLDPLIGLAVIRDGFENSLLIGLWPFALEICRRRV